MLASTLPSPVATPTPADPKAFTAVESLAGRMLGGCRLLKKIGRGGSATVYLAEAGSTQVAVKVLHADAATNPEVVQRFLAEGQALSLVPSDHSVRVHRVGSDPAGHYLVMELLEGELLSERMARGPIPEREALALLLQTCSALSGAHHAGVVHRDLKPENMMVLDRGGEPFIKVLDFGLAKVFDSPSRAKTRAGAVMGTPAYMSPEQGRGDPADARSDLYELGVIAFQMATGRLPFEATGISTMLIAHERTPPPAPRSIRPEISETFERVILKLLAKRPEDRYPDAAATYVALQRARDVTHPPISAPHTRRAPSILEVEIDHPGLPGRMRARELSAGGIYLCTNEAPPPLFSRVSVSLHTPSGPLVLTGEVVRHVSAADAARWGREAGFAVQFPLMDSLRFNALSELVRAVGSN